VAKKDRGVAGKKAKPPKRRRAYFPPVGTVLVQNPETPVTWCVFCRADRHDVCDLAEMRFCDCFQEGHEEEL
jgi:hypothetical protein